jgi:UTP-glucose-1-phosphate uridylyltransferase
MGVTRAVIAAGGVGSKMLPMTTVLAKEMLPVRDKPILDHLDTELRDVGIEEVLF